MNADRRLFFLLHRAHRALFAHVDERAIAELGVTSAQLAALYYVVAHEGCSPSEIAGMLDLAKSAASSVVRRMEKAGVIRRAAHPRDRRSALLYATAKGRRVRDRSVPMVKRLTAEALAGFDAREVDAVLRFLNSVVGRYGNSEEES